jgi:hypothetical protein
MPGKPPLETDAFHDTNCPEVGELRNPLMLDMSGTAIFVPPLI